MTATMSNDVNDRANYQRATSILTFDKIDDSKSMDKSQRSPQSSNSHEAYFKMPQISETIVSPVTEYRQILHLKMGRCLLIVLILLLIICGLLVALYALALQSNRDLERYNYILLNQQSSAVCTTDTCVHHANKMLQHTNLTVDPCDDFYNFACGHYEDPSSVMLNARADIQNFLERKLVEPVEDAEIEPVKIVKTFYQKCMNMSELTIHGPETLSREISRFGGFRIGSESVEDIAWDLTEFVRLLYVRYGQLPLVFITAKAHPSNRSRNIISVIPPFFPLFPFSGYSLVYLLDESVQESLKNNTIDLALKAAALFGITNTSEIVEGLPLKSLISHLFDMMIQHGRLINTYTYTVSAGVEMSLRDVQQLMPNGGLRWVELIQGFNIDSDVNDDYIINVGHPQFLRDLDTWLFETDEKMIRVYLLSGLTTILLGEMSDGFNDVLFNFTVMMQAMPNYKLPRGMKCFSDCRTILPMALSYLYIKDNIGPDIRHQVEEMTDAIRDEFMDQLPSLTWMDPVTSEYALNKAIAMNEVVAYPDYLEDISKFEHMYSAINFDSTEHTYMNLKYTIFSNTFIDEILSHLSRPMNNSAWPFQYAPILVNAAYMPRQNGIRVFAGLLHPLIYYEDAPMYLNFARVGFSIGHELVHGFDASGRRYDKHGDPFNWWDSDTETEFRNQALCLIRQYNNIEVGNTGTHVDGNMTLNENIADNGGIKLAFTAYQQWASEHTEELALPGFQFSIEQLFFVGFAQFWCSKLSVGSLYYLIQNDGHTPAPYRVNGILQNFHQFSDAFSCPLHSPMNPENKCVVW